MITVNVGIIIAAVVTTCIILLFVILYLTGVFDKTSASDPDPNPDPYIHKGINLDDQTSFNIDPETAPRSIFPLSWPTTTSQGIASCRTFKQQETNNYTFKWTIWLLQNGVETLVGFDPAYHRAEVDRMAKAYSSNSKLFNSYIIGYQMGNEITMDQQESVAEGIKYLREKITNGLLPRKPITVNFTYTSSENKAWLKPPDYPPNQIQFTDNFIKFFKQNALDIICFNLYGIFFSPDLVPDKVSLEKALSWVPGESVIVEQFAGLANAMKDSEIDAPVWIGETGWCSKSRKQDNKDLDPKGWSTPVNFKKYYEGFLKFELNTDINCVIDNAEYQFKTPERIWFFCLRDCENDNIQEYFGLYTENVEKLDLKAVLK